MNGHPHSIADKIDGIIRFFLYVLIFWLPYSRAVIESCVIAAFVFWVLKRGFLYYVVEERASVTPKERLREFFKAFSPKPSVLNRPIACFIFFCLLSVIGSAFPEQTWKGFLTKTLEWFVVYFLVVEVFKTRKHIYLLLGVFFVTSLATVIDGLIQYYFTLSDVFFGYLIEKGGRITAGFKNPNLLGGYLAFVVPLTGSLLFIKGKTKRYRPLIAVFLLLTVWALFLTVSRAAWFSGFVGITFLLAFIYRRQVIYGLLIILLAGTCVYFFMPPTVKQEIRLSTADVQGTWGWRKGVWEDSIEMIKDRPLFGHGLNMFMRVFQEYRRKHNVVFEYGPTYAHNGFLQMAAEIGIIGLMIFLWMLGRLFKKTIALYQKNADKQGLGMLEIGLLSSLSALLVHIFFDNDLYTLQLSAYFWFMAGTIASVYKILKTEGIRAIKES